MVARYAFRVIQLHLSRSQLAREHGASQLAICLRTDPILAFDLFVKTVQLAKEHRLVEDLNANGSAIITYDLLKAMKYVRYVLSGSTSETTLSFSFTNNSSFLL